MLLTCLIIVIQSQECQAGGLKIRDQVPKNCIDLAIQRAAQVPSEFELSEQQRKKVLARLSLVQQLILSVRNLKKVRLQPSLRWAQNQTHVQVAFKLTHRWDSPPCTQQLVHRDSVPGNESVYFYEQCISGNQHYQFELDIQLLHPVTQARLKKDGFHWLIVAKKKKNDQVWAYLTTKQVVYPLWLQLAEKYPDVTRKYQSIHQQLSEQKQQGKKRRKRRTGEEKEAEAL